MSLSTTERDRLDKICPAFKGIAAGTEMYNTQQTAGNASTAAAAADVTANAASVTAAAALPKAGGAMTGLVTGFRAAYNTTTLTGMGIKTVTTATPVVIVGPGTASPTVMLTPHTAAGYRYSIIKTSATAASVTVAVVGTLNINASSTYKQLDAAYDSIELMQVDATGNFVILPSKIA